MYCIFIRFMQAFYEWFFLEKGRTGDALFSWPHLLSVTLTLILFLGLGFFLGKKYRDNQKGQNIILLISGISILLVQTAKMIYLCWGTTNLWESLIGNAPLYLCDMAIYIIPLGAITKGRFKDWCMDYIAIWGFIMAFFGTYLAGNIYPAHAAISFSALNSLLNHSISGFVAMFVFVTGLNKMEKRNIPFVVGMLVVVMTAALIIDYVDDHNFMFFFHGDGTPFTLFDEYLSFGLKPIYQLWIYVLQCGYMVGFYFAYYGIYALVDKKKKKKILEEQGA